MSKFELVITGQTETEQFDGGSEFNADDLEEALKGVLFTFNDLGTTSPVKRINISLVNRG